MILRITVVLASLLLLSCNGDNKGTLSNLFMNSSKFEKLVDRFEGNDRDIWQKPNEVISMLGNIGGKTIMDIGSGTGYFSFKLAQRGATVIAADVDERFIEYIANKKIEIKDSLVTSRKVEYDDPLLSNEEVDIVIIVNTYHHINDRVEYFTKVWNGIEQGGLLMVVDFKKVKTEFGPPKRYRISADEAKKELKQSGFSSFTVNADLLENQYVLIAKK